MNRDDQRLHALFTVTPGPLVEPSSRADLTERLDALEARVTALEAAVPVTTEPVDTAVTADAVEMEPVIVERGKPKRSSNRTVGKKK